MKSKYMFKRLLWLMAAGLFFFSCKETKTGTLHIAVHFINADKMIVSGVPALVKTASLQEIVYGKDLPPALLDSAKISGSSGDINLSTKGKPQSVYEVVFGDNYISVPLINDASDIKINIDLAKQEDFYKVEGSEASSQLQELINTFGKKNYVIEKSFTTLDSLKRSGGPDSLAIAATQTKNNAIDDLNNYLKQFINKTSNPTLGILALGWASRSFSKTEFETALNNLQKKYPADAMLQNMKKSYDAQQEAAQKKEEDNSWVGKPAPELSLPDVNGKNISLSSFKGKYVLVDFWASWCGPCRMENPNVVKAYNEFKGKNFTILGVSLDKEKDAWQQAIKQDQLAWDHVSDLKYWNSKAVDVFKFEGIPFNVLIDPQGKIIAQELRGEDLENKLSQVLK